MKHFKFILPAMVFVMAIGMSFASIGLEEGQMLQSYLSTDGCKVIEDVCDNAPSGQFCQVESEEFGGPYDVVSGTTCSGTQLRHSNPNPIQIP